MAFLYFRPNYPQKMQQNWARLLLLIILLGTQLSVTSLYAQQYYFRNFRVENGLPQSQVYDVIQDARGFIWVATNGGGVARYDGKKFQNFTKEHGLVDDHVRRIWEDKLGNIWFLTYYGLSRYDGLHFHNYGVKDGFPESVFIDVYEDKPGELIIFLLQGPDQARLFRANKDGFAPLEFAQLRHDDIYGELYLTSVVQWNQGLLIKGKSGWYQFKNGTLESIGLPVPIRASNYVRPLFNNVNDELFLLSYQQRKWVLWEVSSNTEYQEWTLPPEIIPTRITQVFRDHDGDLWLVVQNEGLINISSSRPIRFNKASGFNGASDFIFKVIQDHENSFWIGTSVTGLFQYLDKQITYFGEQEGIGHPEVSALHSLDSQKVLIGLNDGELLMKEERGIREITNLGEKLGRVKQFRKMGSEHIWVVGHEGILSLHLPTGNFLFPPRLNQNLNLRRLSTLALREDEIWVGSIYDGLRVIFPNGQTKEIQSLPSRDIRYLFLDSQNRLWVCTNFGISCIAQGAYQPDQIDFKDKINRVLVFQALEDRQGRMWFATYGEGILMFDGKSWIKYDKSQGLDSDNVYGLSLDGQGHLWVSLQRSVEELDISGDEISPLRKFNVHRGYLGYENNPAAISAIGDFIWVGSTNGLYRIDQSVQESANLPQMRILDIDLDYENTNWLSFPFRTYGKDIDPWTGFPKDLEIPRNNNLLSLDLGLSSYRYPENFQFRWKLEGSGGRWSAWQPIQDLNIYNLGPGKYELITQLRTIEGKEGEEQMLLRFTILPPFWQNSYVYFLITATLVLITLLVVRWSVRARVRKKLERFSQQSKLVKERQRIARDLHDNVGSHLTYMITSLDELSEESPPHIRMQLEQLRAYGKSTIDQLRETIWAIHKEGFTITELCDRIKSLVYHFNQTRNIEIQFQIEGDTEKEISPVQILNIFRITQEAVNNAFKHSECSMLQVQICVSDTWLLLKIMDNGKGFDRKNANLIFGYGLVNMEERSNDIGASWSIDSAPGQGTKVTVRLPLNSEMIE